MPISYPGPGPHVEAAAFELNAPHAADQARRLQPLLRFSGLVGAAVELARAATPDDDAGVLPVAVKAQLAKIMAEAAKDIQTLAVAANAAAAIYTEYCGAFGLDPVATLFYFKDTPMAGEKQPDVVGRALRPQETHGATPAEPVKSSDPNVTGPAEAAGIPVEAGPGPAAPKAPVPAPGELPPAERKPQEEVERDLMNTPQSAREQEAAGDPAKDPNQAPRPTTAAPLIPPAQAPGYVPPPGAEPKLGRAPKDKK